MKQYQKAEFANAEEAAAFIAALSRVLASPGYTWSAREEASVHVLADPSGASANVYLSETAATAAQQAFAARLGVQVIDRSAVPATARTIMRSSDAVPMGIDSVVQLLAPLSI